MDDFGLILRVWLVWTGMLHAGVFGCLMAIAVIKVLEFIFEDRGGGPSQRN